MAKDGRPPAVQSGKIHDRPFLRRNCFCTGDDRRHAYRRWTSESNVAGWRLLSTNSWRALPEPGWSQHGHETVSRSDGWLDDGRLVSFDLDWKLYRRPDDEIVCR